MRLVAIDNNIAAWAVRRVASPGQEYRLADAKEFIDRLKREQTAIALPMIVVGEYLSALPTHKQAASLAVLQRRFRLFTYDAQCALYAARLWRMKKEESGEIDGHKEEFPEATHTKIKSDLKIIATCIVNRVDVLYSEDRQLRNLAKGRLQAEGMFQTGEGRQISLF